MTATARSALLTLGEQEDVLRVGGQPAGPAQLAAELFPQVPMGRADHVAAVQAGDVFGPPGRRGGQPHGPGPVPLGDQRGVGLAGPQVVADGSGLSRSLARRRRQRPAEGAGPGGRGRAVLDVGGSARPGGQEPGRGEFLVGPHHGRAGQPERRGQGPGGRQPVTVVQLAARDGPDQRVRHLAGPRAVRPGQLQREVDRGGRPGQVPAWTFCSAMASVCRTCPTGWPAAWRRIMAVGGRPLRACFGRRIVRISSQTGGGGAGRRTGGPDGHDRSNRRPGRRRR